MDEVAEHEPHSRGQTSLNCIITRPLDSGYVRFVVRSAVEFLQSGEHGEVAGITVSAPFAGAHSVRLLELALRDAQEHGVRGHLVLDGERCELRLSRCAENPGVDASN